MQACHASTWETQAEGQGTQNYSWTMLTYATWGKERKE